MCVRLNSASVVSVFEASVSVRLMRLRWVWVKLLCLYSLQTQKLHTHLCEVECL